MTPLLRPVCIGLSGCRHGTVLRYGAISLTAGTSAAVIAAGLTLARDHALISLPVLNGLEVRPTVCAYGVGRSAVMSFVT
jgi:hypothetical protein